jgi:hypothetical protein
MSRADEFKAEGPDKMVVKVGMVGDAQVRGHCRLLLLLVDTTAAVVALVVVVVVVVFLQSTKRAASYKSVRVRG